MEFQRRNAMCESIMKNIQDGLATVKDKHKLQEHVSWIASALVNLRRTVIKDEVAKKDLLEQMEAKMQAISNWERDQTYSENLAASKNDGRGSGTSVNTGAYC